MMSMYAQLDAISQQVRATAERKNAPSEPIRDRILKLIAQRPDITTPEMAEALDRTARSLSSETSKLLRDGLIVGKKLPKSHFVGYRLGDGVPPTNPGRPTCTSCIMDLLADGEIYTTTMMKENMDHSVNTIRQTASRLVFTGKLKLAGTQVHGGLKTNYYQKA